MLTETAAALGAGDLARAAVLAGLALESGVEHPVLYTLRAQTAEADGRLEDALEDLRRAHRLAPRDVVVLSALGICLTKLDRTDEAVRAFDDALAVEQGWAELWYVRGYALELCSEIVAARRSYERAVAIAPGHASALAALAALAVRRGDLTGGRDLAERALALDASQIAAGLALADIELGEGAHAATEARLRAILLREDLSAENRRETLGRLGDVLDARGDPRAAFAAYAAGAKELRQAVRARFETPGVASASEVLDRLIAYFENVGPEAWARPPEPVSAGRPSEVAGARGHVFLVGFPRSGTTLLENVLASDPTVISLEEKETLNEAAIAFLGDPGSLDRLGAASDAELEPYRAAYWRRVREYGAEVGGKVFIDKNPLGSLKLPLVARLFPAARVLFAVRDPRDVVLSCFRRRFVLNAPNYELLDLEGAAHLYDRIMRLVELYRARLPLQEHRVVYETFVAGFEEAAAAACAFIGVEPPTRAADFAARARRGEVASASAAQIARGLYDGSGGWRRYAEDLAPVLPILAPWVERFGYPTV